jgi:hypothetical protein
MPRVTAQKIKGSSARNNRLGGVNRGTGAKRAGSYKKISLSKRTAGLDICTVEANQTIGVVRPSNKEVWTYALVLPPRANYPKSIFVDFKSDKGAFQIPFGTEIQIPLLKRGHVILGDLRGEQVDLTKTKSCIVGGQIVQLTPCLFNVGDLIAVERPSFVVKGTKDWIYSRVLPADAKHPGTVVVDTDIEDGAVALPIGTKIGIPGVLPKVLPADGDIRGVRINANDVLLCTLGGYKMGLAAPAVGGGRRAGTQRGGARLINGPHSRTCSTWHSFRNTKEEQIYQARDLAQNLRGEANDGCYRDWLRPTLEEVAQLILNKAKEYEDSKETKYYPDRDAGIPYRAAAFAEGVYNVARRF